MAANVRAVAGDALSRIPDAGQTRPTPALLVALALFTAIAPFATDMYLPAFPEITSDLATSPSAVQLTLTTFLVGIAVGQLLFGPASDRLGRKPPLVVGTSVCAAASLVAALAWNVEVLLAARFVQGLTGAAGVVIARAIVSDLYRGSDAARAYSLLGVLVGLAPVAAPLVGGVLAAPLGWRGILLILFALTAVMLLVAVVFVPETAPHAGRPATQAGDKESEPLQGTAATTLARVLRRPAFIVPALIPTFAFMALMAYISASPFVFQRLIGVDALGSGLLFALNALAMIATSVVNARIVGRFGARRLLTVGLTMLATASLLLGVLVLRGSPARWLVLPLFLLVGSMGLIFGNAVALAIGEARDAAGSGSAFIGFGQFVGGALVAPLVGLQGQDTAVPLAVVMLVATTAAWGCLLLTARTPPPSAS